MIAIEDTATPHDEIVATAGAAIRHDTDDMCKYIVVWAFDGLSFKRVEEKREGDRATLPTEIP